MGESGGRLERIPVRGKAPADAGEINAAVPDKPVFILYLYGLGFLNQKGIATLGYTKDTKYKDGEVELGADGKPTGKLIAKPNALILYSTLAKTNKLSREDQLNSTLHFTAS
jgi:predicted amidohydrolase YtcJ